MPMYTDPESDELASQARLRKVLERANAMKASRAPMNTSNDHLPVCGVCRGIFSLQDLCDKHKVEKENARKIEKSKVTEHHLRNQRYEATGRFEFCGHCFPLTSGADDICFYCSHFMNDEACKTYVVAEMERRVKNDEWVDCAGCYPLTSTTGALCGEKH